EESIPNLRSLLTKKEQAREDFLTRQLALLASQEPWSPTGGKPIVQEFRDAILGGNTLGRLEAREFLKSEGLYFFQYDFYRKNGIPFTAQSKTVRLQPMSAEGREVFTAATEFVFRWPPRGRARAVLGERVNRGFTTVQAPPFTLIGRTALKGSVMDALR